MTGLFLLALLAAPDRQALVEEYFKADAARRIEIRKELAPVDVLTKKEVAKWRPIILKLASRGKKLRKKGLNYFYDKKTKRGKYIVSGSTGKGGLLVGLHGGGEGAGDAGSAAGTFGSIASKFRCAGVFPEVLVKTERGWTTSGTEEFLLELIEAAKRTWKIDPDRVYMVGHSMGGFGSWTVGAHHADLFAGLGPYAGAPTPYTADGKPYGEVVGLVEGVIPNLRSVALHVYQSLDDPQVPPAPNVFANKEVLRWKKDYGGYEHYKYVEVDKRGHGAPPGGHIEGFRWLYQFKREPRPKHILWEPVLSYKRMFYWLWWDRPGAKVLVQAKITSPNEIQLDFSGADLAGVRIFLDEELVDLSMEIIVREGSEVVFKGKVPYTLSSLLMTGAEKYDRQMLFPARIDL
ncbi:MAG: hypothetical protein ACYSX0_08170 [Planctomycetota bacterium]|jgi:pimeloyl-ACP methyl ester carboxylesterase